MSGGHSLAFEVQCLDARVRRIDSFVLEYSEHCNSTWRSQTQLNEASAARLAHLEALTSCQHRTITTLNASNDQLLQLVDNLYAILRRNGIE